MTADELTGRLAGLAVDFGANLQPGQLLFVQAEPAHAPLVRAVAAAAYRRGATFVDAFYFDPWVKRARIAYAAGGHARVRAAVVLRAHPRPRRAALRPALDHGQQRTRAVRRPRRGTRRPRPAAAPEGDGHDRQRPHHELDDRPLPDAGLGGEGPPRPRRRGAREADRRARARAPPGRARSGRRLAHALPRHERRRRAPDRAALRRAALRRPGHRPHHRPASRARAGPPPPSRPSTGSSTSRTCPPRRSSRRRTRSGSTAT